MPKQSYAIALGSNKRGRHGSPRHEVMAALARIGPVSGASPIVETPPLGPSRRRYANMVAIIESNLSPPDLLTHLKAIERDFGRRPGKRWGSRVIDLDIILWSEGSWADRQITVPHPAFRERRFVLDPLLAVAARWRDPVSGYSVRQLHYRAARG